MTAYFAEGTEAMVALEAMVDRVGMDNVIHALARIAREKADHLQSNWQDTHAARVWNNTANRLDSFAAKVQV